MSLGWSRVTFLTSVLLLASASWTPVPAQVASPACADNLVANGNFVGGLAPWSTAYGSPDYSGSMGCQDPGYVGMWGNLVVGEALQQNLAMNPLVGGTTYVVSLCVRHGNDPTKLAYSKFRLRASSTPLTSVTGGQTVGPLHNTPNPSQISGSNWSTVSVIWTAPGSVSYPFLTLSVENNSTVNDGSQTSYGHIDNVCIRKLDFTAAAVCQGQATTFTSNATGATSWTWNFGDGGSSSQQNPTHIYAAAGTYNATLCVNGTTSCVTKPVTVHPKPPAPVIVGPTNLCNGLTATYSVASASGVTYAWTVSNGTINGSATGSSVNVTWNQGGGTISVSATNAQGCLSRSTLQVFDCNLWLEKCCHEIKLSATAPQPVHVGSNVYALTPTLSSAPPLSAIRVAANLISTERTFSSPSCGTNGPVSSHIVSASPSAPVGFVPSIPVAFSREVVWHGAGSLGLSGVAFPFQIQFPPPPAPPSCSDTLKFCVKYTVTMSNCRSCEIIRCYSVVRKKIIWWPDDLANTGSVSVGQPFTAAVQVESPQGGRTPGPLTLGIKPGTGARGARLRGRTTAEVVDGTATFAGISIDRAGEGYVLVVSGPNLREPIESEPFAVTGETPRP